MIERSSRARRRFVALVAVVALLALWHPARAHVRAAGLLVRFTDPAAKGFPADAGRNPVDVRDESIAGTRARVYSPRGVDDPPGLVVVHGVHWKGIDEPRLQRFASAIAASGVLVLTPEIRELCDYRMDPASARTIGESARALSDRLGARVGVMGLSFAGGLSLVAASDPRYESAIGFVVSLGGHDDLGRVLRFFVTDDAPQPDGSTLHVHAHDYGAVVLEYSHAEDFFPPEDLDAARDTLRFVLHEDFDAATRRTSALSPASAARMRHILEHDTSALAPELLAEIARLEPQLGAVSPSAHVGRIHVPVFVLHGAGDTLIPPSEALWLEHDTPRAMLREVLVSPAIEHVGLEAQTTLGDSLGLVAFMSDVLDAADENEHGARALLAR
jgi:dienelactone hydrolase